MNIINIEPIILYPAKGIPRVFQHLNMHNEDRTYLMFFLIASNAASMISDFSVCVL